MTGKTHSIRHDPHDRHQEEQELKPAHSKWQASFDAQIGKDRPLRNRSGIEVAPLYTPLDWDNERYMTDLGFPGQDSMTRGIYPTMHRGRPWTQRQLVGLGTPRESVRSA